VGRALASNERIRRTIKDIQRVKTWQLVLLLILMLFVAATFLRLNNVGMEQRRDAVISADKAGNDAQIVQALYNLQQFVTGHMNTDLGKGVYLQYSYARAQVALGQAAASSIDPNGNVYQKASAYCDPQYHYYTYAYQECILQQLAKYPGASALANPSSNALSTSLYVHNYASPLWSPDFAGWSVIACLVIALLIIGRLITLAILRIMLRFKYRSL